ncbi:hypothetical protein JCM10212_003538 [Sporobolomyces blumeae]
MSRPIVLSTDDISPLSLSTSPRCLSPAFSDLSLGGTTVVVDPAQFDAMSLSSGSSSSSCDDACCRSLSNSPESSPSPLSDDSISLPDTDDSCIDPRCCPPTSDPTSRKAIRSIPADAFQPLVIVGAGPHSLALAARLSEPRPAALYTDLEHARLSWLKREQVQSADGRKTKEKRRTVKGHWTARKLVQPDRATLATPIGGVETDLSSNTRGIKVLDATSDSWMARWNGFFAGLRIEHLRSPMLFHPHPADVDSLVAYSKRVGGEAQLEPIHGVVGKEMSKHQRKKRKQHRVNGAQPINERDRQDYFRPSTRLFGNFIAEDLIERYDLAPLVTHSTVTSITYGPLHVEGHEPSEGFVIESENPDGTTSVSASKAVVVAPGPSNRPNIPAVISSALPSSSSMLRASASGCDPSPWDLDEIRGPAWCHSSAFSTEGFTPIGQNALGEKVRQGLPTSVVVIGGGLTSVQIVSSLLDQGVSKVHLICRSRIKVKHFDFPLEWVSKYNNLEKASFWNSPTYEDRLATIQQARDGGSVNPTFYKLLHKFVREGRVELRTLSEIVEAEYAGPDAGWTFEGRTTHPRATKVGADDDVLAPLMEPEGWTLSGIDYLICSTGSKVSLDALPFLSTIRRTHPIDEVGNLPCLTGDLQWTDELPLFVMGAFSMLELGPDALNLSGTRTGAERIAHRLGELGIFETVSSREGVADEEVDGSRAKKPSRMDEKEHRSGGRGNYFLGLSNEVEA